jgi:hypothetical protein
LAAIGAGEYVGALIRELDGLLATDSSPEEFAVAQIKAAQEQGRLSASDAQLLLAHVTRASATDAAPAPTAAELFRRAVDDPTSSPITLTLLSIAKYHEENSTVRHDDYKEGYAWGYAVALGAGPMVLAIEALSHVSVTVSYRP